MSSQSKLRPPSRPVSAIIATTHTNVTSQTHVTTQGLKTTITTLNSTTDGSISSSAPAPAPAPSSKTNSFDGIDRLSGGESFVYQQEFSNGGNFPTESNSHDLQEIDFLYTLYGTSASTAATAAPTTKQKAKTITMTNASKRQYLMKTLPKLTYDEDLNLQLHFFLSTIMIQFVNSWYLTKFNTREMKFLNILYDDVMVRFVKDLARRIEQLNAVQVLDELISIFDQHIEEFSCTTKDEEKSGFRVVSEHYKRARSTNSLYYDADSCPRDVLDLYLSQQHLIFEEGIEEEKNQLENPQHLLYFRIMSKQILKKSLQYGGGGGCDYDDDDDDDDDHWKDPIFTSKIAGDILVLIMGDIVLNKTLEKLSTPEFILKTIHNLVSSMLQRMSQRKEDENDKIALVPVSEKIRRMLTAACSFIVRLVALSSVSNEAEPSDIVSSSIFKLLASVCYIIMPKPLLYQALVTLQTVILSCSQVNSWINTVFMNWFSQMMADFDIPEKVASLVNNLRISLFYSNNEATEKESLPPTTDTDVLTDKTIELFTLLPISRGAESSNEQRKLIKRVLTVFAENNEVDPEHKVNKYLVIKLLDYLVRTLYNEI
ncbi:hypothetical protein KGF56_003345 [Candida oxycetoniae]|uniref:PXA domain-containing protein n=1 Tax=Candida oxycetoniae TaxID=497107 RepID=A0AAI9SWN4_9ASCO|nr:uncharacterized protein KGF56_003345 [Candida oxycetoniae]KAI3403915.2 hypothetical protein KGF56_003345 [Candida oxycetoniae]